MTNIPSTFRSMSLNVGASSPGRTTSNADFSSKFRSVIGGGLNAGANTVQRVSPFVPGSAVLSAALSEANRHITSGDETVVAGGDGLNISPPTGGTAGFMGQMDQMQEKMMSTNLYMINLQRKFQQMSEHYSTISNVLKTKHDTERNSIANIK